MTTINLTAAEGDFVMATLSGSWCHGLVGVVLSPDATDENDDNGMRIKFDAGVTILAVDEVFVIPESLGPIIRPLAAMAKLADHPLPFLCEGDCTCGLDAARAALEVALL
jgi:hypothetical protein